MDGARIDYGVRFGNLREWIGEAEKLGDLRQVEGASWEKDIGLATELLQHDETAPCALFDGIPGFPKGDWSLTNFLGGTRQNMTLGFAMHLTNVELSNAFLERYRQAIASPIPYGSSRAARSWKTSSASTT